MIRVFVSNLSFLIEITSDNNFCYVTAVGDTVAEDEVIGGIETDKVKLFPQLIYSVW